MIVIGCDPGLGVKSPTGLAIIDTADYSILVCDDLWTDRKKQLHSRLQDLSTKLCKKLGTLGLYMDQSDKDDILFAVEYFVMAGKGGQSLQRLVGAYYAMLPLECAAIEVQNTKVKMCVGGAGSDSKEEVAQGVHGWFKDKNKESAKLVKKLINEEAWDRLDALAIAITGYLTYASS